MVAFLQRLPGISADEYRWLVAGAPDGHDAMMRGMGSKALCGRIIRSRPQEIDQMKAILACM